MRKFNVNVNGNSYEVEVEEVAATAAAPVQAAPQAVAVAPKAAVVAPKAAPAAPKAAPAVSGNGTKLVSPLPGTVLKLAVANGSKVKNNDVVLIIEAMKMENEVRANADGTINFAVAQGASVNSGDALAYIG